MGRRTLTGDMVGKIYGALLAYDTVFVRHEYWLKCRCLQCGAVVIRRGCEVRKSPATCGMRCGAVPTARDRRYAEREKKIRALFPQGLRVYNLTVLALNDDLKTVRLRCDCGNEVERFTRYLLNGRVKQCSCYCKLSITRISRSKHKFNLEKLGPRTHGATCPCHPCRMMRQIDKVLALRKQLRAMGRVA